ncbi:MAG: PBP1A family penicillin-binding protein [Clostridia bacterium]|nr:PBP1A family penicillin-binding protein [Clostridia bacterium]
MGFRRWLQPFLWLIALLVLFGAAAWGYETFNVADWQRLDPGKLTNLAETGAIYDKDGNYVTTLVGRENRTVIDTSTLPRHVVDAFLAAEDLRFYKHPGFDVIRILGAVVNNVKSGDFDQGASTITQQLVKLSHLSSQKTIARKLEEIWLALQMEQLYSKEQILDLYLNYIYFGQGAYGIQAAAQVTFGVDAAELSPAQAAALASAIKAPSAYSIQAAPENNRQRRDYILSVMRDEGMLTQAQYDAAVQEQLTPKKASAVQTAYGWFVDAVLDEAELLLDVSAEMLLAGGYRIDTTLDPAMQTVLDQQFENTSVFPGNAKDGTPVQAAAAAIENASGAVRAIVGGRQYETRRGLNRATHLRRQPGSALKPLAVYAPAVEYAGWTAASVILDEPTSFGSYAPKNAGNAYYGNVTLRAALKNSLNIPAVKVIEEIGVGTARRYLTNVGIELDNRDWNLSLALGSMTYGASPVQMAAAYAPFANGGTFHAPYFIEAITDRSGAVLYRHHDSGTRVLSRQSAYLLTDLMRTVIASGTGTRLNSAGVQVAGKTGTVNMAGGGNRDAWMNAYTPDLSVCVWMGFDEPDQNHRLSNSVSGGTNPASLARNFLKAWYANKKKPTFRSPGGFVTVTLDKKAIEWRGEPMLATSLTPDAYKIKEIFIEGTQPTKKSDVWQPPASARSFHVSHDENGQPRLVITASEAAVYRIQRDAVGESFILTELRADAGQTITYVDSRARDGVTYTYRVVPVHAELLDNGILLEGKQSVQVARVERPSFGDWLQGLFRRERDDEEDEDQPVSLFTP